VGQCIQEFGKLSDQGALRGFGIEAAIHRSCEDSRDAPVGADRVGSTLELLVLASCLGLESSSAAGGVEERGANAPNIGGLAEEATAGLLGGHILAGPYAPTAGAPPAVGATSSFVGARRG
jgi:hypothetical protein